HPRAHRHPGRCVGDRSHCILHPKKLVPASVRWSRSLARCLARVDARGGELEAFGHSAQATCGRTSCAIGARGQSSGRSCKSNVLSAKRPCRQNPLLRPPCLSSRLTVLAWGGFCSGLALHRITASRTWWSLSRSPRPTTKGGRTSLPPSVTSALSWPTCPIRVSSFASLG